MRALDSIPLARALAGLPSVFPVHTTVVYCGVYPTVQRSRGSVASQTFLLDVPVLTAAFRPPTRARKLFHPAGLAPLSARISVIMYAAAGKTTCVGVGGSIFISFH